MQESTELKALILKWYESRTVGEILGFLERLLSHQDGFMAIGTDLSEWGLGSEQIINGYKEMDRTGKIEVKVVNLRAWCEGAVGWIADHVLYTLPDGTSVPVRHTYILHKENNEWKIVHIHYSIAMSTPEIN
jgi:hypothetical protein